MPFFPTQAHVATEWSTLVSEEQNVFQEFADGLPLISLTGTQSKSAVMPWKQWTRSLFPEHFTKPFSTYHTEFWNYLWTIEPIIKANPFVGIWPRGGGKSTNVEAGCIALADRRVKKYVLYVSNTQDQADDHVQNIAGLLESPEVAGYNALLAQRKVGKYGASKGWRRNRVSTSSGFTVDAMGLDVAARGAKLDADRPDLIIFDDLDDDGDTELKIQKKIRAITRKLIPAGSESLTVIAVQNLVHEHSIFSRMVDGRADFLSKRRISGPFPALRDFKYEKVNEAYVITSGKPTWVGMSLQDCQGKLDDMGLVAFQTELQHERAISEGSILGEWWKESVHVLQPFAIPKTWRIYRAFDYGYSHPFAVGWFARCDGSRAPNGVTYPNGTLVHVAEWYGWNGKPNIGARMEAVDIAIQIKILEARWFPGRKIKVGPADSSIYDPPESACIATKMASKGVLWEPCDKRPGSRVTGAILFADKLKAGLKHPVERPAFYVFENCKHFIRTIPYIPRDPSDPDDAWTEAEDHIYDMVRYMLTFNRKPASVGSILGNF
jgi:hypothetical protein